MPSFKLPHSFAMAPGGRSGSGNEAVEDDNPYQTLPGGPGAGFSSEKSRRAAFPGKKSGVQPKDDHDVGHTPPQGRDVLGERPQSMSLLRKLFT